MKKRKRLFDIIFSLLALIITTPLILLISLLLFLTSKNKKIIYSHERIGRKGKPFLCYKFQTMYPDSDKKLTQLLEEDLELRKEWETNRKIKKDPRVTPFGAFLRRTSLDELPQFWNVIKGDLSVVGPRPVVKEEIHQHFGNKAEKILSIRPGITGMWQTSGRSNISYCQRIHLDETYVDNQSLILDIKLIAKTIPKIICTKDAY